MEFWCCCITDSLGIPDAAVAVDDTADVKPATATTDADAISFEDDGG